MELVYCQTEKFKKTLSIVGNVGWVKRKKKKKRLNRDLARNKNKEGLWFNRNMAKDQPTN